MHFALDRMNWEILGPLEADGSGFGRLFEVQGASGEIGVAKVVPKAPGAERELLLGDSIAAANLKHAIPILDTGEHEDNWVLVMPRADCSLAQHLARSAVPLPLAESIAILKDIADALAEIDGGIVHRDLKPANILRHDGSWKLADFGVARYSVAITSDSTRKQHFSSPYAAPEQWEHRHATSATDVYAFGVIAFELLAGSRPFVGPSREDYREQHVKSPAPELATGTAKLRILVEECLYKDPSVRPSPRALLVRIKSAEASNQQAGASKLASFSHSVVRERAQEQAALNEYRERQEQRLRQVTAADRSIQHITSAMRAEIEDNAPIAEFARVVGNDAPIFRVSLGDATLTFDRVRPVEHWDTPFTTIASSRIDLDFGRVGADWQGRSHSLWYCDAKEPGTFGWFELAFMSSPSAARSPQIEPFARTPYEAQPAFGGGVGSMQLAWSVTEVDPSDPQEFVQRWLDWFAEAAAGRLRRPSTMPEREVRRTHR